jgi:hypothetical protein
MGGLAGAYYGSTKYNSKKYDIFYPAVLDRYTKLYTTA